MDGYYFSGVVEGSSYVASQNGNLNKRRIEEGQENNKHFRPNLRNLAEGGLMCGNVMFTPNSLG